MASDQFVAEFGVAYTGLPVGYTFYDKTGVATTARSTTGVVEVPAGSGTFLVALDYADEFAGALVMDTGTGKTKTFPITPGGFYVSPPSLPHNGFPGL